MIWSGSRGNLLSISHQTTFFLWEVFLSMEYSSYNLSMGLTNWIRVHSPIVINTFFLQHVQICTSCHVFGEQSGIPNVVALFPSKLHWNFLKLSFPQEGSNWISVQISSEKNHWVFDVCPRVRGHSDFGILSSFGASSILP